ncbi:MAG TPA: hemerythrin domain-containing protein [Thermoanaerobaculia bacterium]|nr:hemerythrin domain-containing protein [Thermoanaerobaculia bacterium]
MVHAVVAERELDVRDTTGADAAARTLAAFDALSPGERFVVVSRDSGAGTLSRLQVERSGLFEWSPLVLGPPVWRFEVTRRTPSLAGPRRLAEALAWDHGRLDALEAAAFRTRESGDLPSAFDLFAQFASGLSRHIDAEEAIVFPLFEDRAGLPPSAGPTAAMRTEHRRIRELLREVEGAIGDAAGEVEAPRTALRALLAVHDLKEERILYPAVDSLLSDGEADAIVRCIQRFDGRRAAGVRLG